jgi:hypothetical protein
VPSASAAGTVLDADHVAHPSEPDEQPTVPDLIHTDPPKQASPKQATPKVNKPRSTPKAANTKQSPRGDDNPPLFL